jgi:hypothetical protein
MKKLPNIAFFILIVLILNQNIILSQTTGESIHKKDLETIDKSIEESLEQSQNESDESILNEFESYKKKHINFLKAKINSLSRLPAISIQDANQIVKFRDSTKSINFDEYKFLTEKQLAALNNFTFIPEEKAINVNDFKLSLRTRFVQDLQKRKGYISDLKRIKIVSDSIGTNHSDTISVGLPYLGSEASMLTKINLEYFGLYLNLLFEKDAGEPITINDTLNFNYSNYEKIYGKNNVSDTSKLNVKKSFCAFISGSASYNFNWGKIIIGDFNAEFGQGLILGGSGGGGKSEEVVKQTYRSMRGLTNYSSTGEVSFLRGCSLSIKDTISGISGFTFYSNRLLPASLNLSSDSILKVSSISVDGFNRTHSELRKNNNFSEIIFGGAISKEFTNAKVEFSIIKTKYSNPFLSNYLYEFSSNENVNISLSGEYNFDKSCFFIELTKSSFNKYALVIGSILKFPKFDASIHFRNIEAGYFSPKGIIFANKSVSPENEQGVYFGLAFKPLINFSVSTYFDLSRSFERTYFVPQPLSNIDAALYVEYKLNSQLTFKCRFRTTSKDDAYKNIDKQLIEKIIIDKRNFYNSRIEAIFISKKNDFSLKCRIEKTFVDYGTNKCSSQGYMSYLDISYKPNENLQFRTRVSMFRTDNFESALYEFENDIPGKLTNSIMYGCGRRFYAIAKWQLSEQISLSVKYSETFYYDRKFQSEGSLQEINSPLYNTISIQLDLDL